jgi:hypothetical protein
LYNKIRVPVKNHQLTSSVALWLVTAVFCSAEPAHFWLSASSTAPGGPEAPTITIPNSGSGQVHVWGRPMTQKKVANLSLNLIASHPGIDFLDTGIVVYNTISGALQRFEYVADATVVPPLRSTRTAAQVAAGQADSIRGLQGFTLMAGPTIRGIGTRCVAGESGCFLAADGEPALLIASASFNAIQSGSSTELFLQIGEHGISHETVPLGDYDFNSAVDELDYETWTHEFGSNTGLWADGNDDGGVDAADYVAWRKTLSGFGFVESSNLTSVRFGVGPAPEPIYNAATNRQTTLTGDHADAVIAVSGAGGGAIALGVPEPGVIFVLLAGALVFGTCRSAMGRANPGQ